VNRTIRVRYTLIKGYKNYKIIIIQDKITILKQLYLFITSFSPEDGVGTQAWMTTYVSILRIPQMIWVWRATVERYWQGENEELGEKPVPVSLCSPQIPHALTRARNRASAVRSRRLTTWAMARTLQNQLLQGILYTLRLMTDSIRFFLFFYLWHCIDILFKIRYLHSTVIVRYYVGVRIYYKPYTELNQRSYSSLLMLMVISCWLDTDYVASGYESSVTSQMWGEGKE
jgi:hypothetical protein